MTFRIGTYETTLMKHGIQQEMGEFVTLINGLVKLTIQLLILRTHLYLFEISFHCISKQL